jgi:hypothetical protein
MIKFLIEMAEVEYQFVQIRQDLWERFNVLTYDHLWRRSSMSTRPLSLMSACAALRSAEFMQAIRRHKLILLWVAATFVILVGTGLALRPDRDLAQYVKYQNVGIYPSDLQARQLITHFQLLRGDGLELDRVKESLLSSGSLTNEAWSRVMKHQAVLGAKLRAKERIAFFVAIVLVPPLTVLELGAALFWARRGYGVLLKARSKGAGPAKDQGS